ncbi:CYTH and CHAD domain-containing protein [Streptomyces sp. MST-110588]|uniref:CYTH and CHAD domain-containing protein n=1 Tax=Streptomyces sp. MST-110588 TaxID=2833628 RepID=UPI001F5DA5A5|nr:CYTH and CHAD domain-containing protein [Streptomyces sp. MST-110588]UNO42020.1 CYTH and CHAD domain-containing protein [Streptomyces sp. MST-110588]
MAETVREIERKYEATDGAGVPDLTGVTSVTGVATVTDEGTVHLDATYYDTVDRRLAADGSTLRRRTGGADAGWHLKLPVAPGVRDEVRAPLTDTLPPELAALVRSRVRGGELAPVVRLRTRRTVRVLRDARGTPLAEVAIDAVRAERLAGADGAAGAAASAGSDGPAGGNGADGAESTGGVNGAVGASRRGRPHARWVEIEVELTEGGDPRLLDAIDTVLTGAGLRPATAASKLARALAETAPRPPDGTPREPGSAELGSAEPGSAEPASGKRAPASRRRRRAGAAPPTAGDTVLMYVRDQVRAIVELDPAVRRDLPDSVHRMRVATRRLRSAFRSYGTLLDRCVTDPIGDELKWLAGELGADRDREVLCERLHGALGELPRELLLGPVEARLTIWSRRRQLGSRSRLIEALDGERHLALLEELHTLLEDPPLRPAAARPPKKVLAKAVRKDYRRLARRMDAVRHAPPGRERDEALHRARKAAKRTRYAAEAARPALGGPAKKFAGRAKRVQQVLGDHQDSVVAREALRELATQAQAAGEGGFAFGVLYGREEARAADRERELPGVWKKVSRPKLRARLGP